MLASAAFGRAVCPGGRRESGLVEILALGTLAVDTMDGTAGDPVAQGARVIGNPAGPGGGIPPSGPARPSGTAGRRADDNGARAGILVAVVAHGAFVPPEVETRGRSVLNDGGIPVEPPGPVGIGCDFVWILSVIAAALGSLSHRNKLPK